jgi:hypothetical protein
MYKKQNEMRVNNFMHFIITFFMSILLNFLLLRLRGSAILKLLFQSFNMKPTLENNKAFEQVTLT